VLFESKTELCVWSPRNEKTKHFAVTNTKHFSGFRLCRKEKTQMTKIWDDIPNDCKSIVFSYLHHLQYDSLTLINKDTQQLIGGSTRDYYKITYESTSHVSARSIIGRMINVSTDQINHLFVCDSMTINIDLFVKFVTNSTLENYSGHVCRFVHQAKNIRNLSVRGNPTYDQIVPFLLFARKMCPKLELLVIERLSLRGLIGHEVLTTKDSPIRVYCFDIQYRSLYGKHKHKKLYPNLKTCTKNIFTSDMGFAFPKFHKMMFGVDLLDFKSQNQSHTKSIIEQVQSTQQFCLRSSDYACLILSFDVYEPLVSAIVERTKSTDCVHNDCIGVPLMTIQCTDHLLDSLSHQRNCISIGKISESQLEFFFGWMLQNGANQSAFKFSDNTIAKHNNLLMRAGFTIDNTNQKTKTQ
jgi:hypothetical protein